MGYDYAWDDKRERDRKLKPGNAKRILSLDGGGIRGLLSCGILKSIEDTLRARVKDECKRKAFVLADYYDLIVGTSTGAIIAVWLALGKSVKDLEQLYKDLGPEVFGKPKHLIGKFLISHFDGQRLDDILEWELATKSLNSRELRTGFGVTTKRMDTAAAWVVSNNPKAPFWDGSNTSHPNADILLRDLVRSSAAAPAYFDHIAVRIERDANLAPGAFMDGAVAGHNNPSLAFLLHVTTPALGLQWQTGDDKLLITSVGTGEFRDRLSSNRLKWMPAAHTAIRSLASSIQDVSKNQLMILQSLSKTLAYQPVNSEWDWPLAEAQKVEDKTLQYCITPSPLCSFQRYDAILDSQKLHDLGCRERGQAYSPGVMKNLWRLDCVYQTNLDRLETIGEAVGKTFVKDDQFPKHFDVDVMRSPDQVA